MTAEMRTWLVMLRDVTDAVRIKGIERVSASLILDMDTGLALGSAFAGDPGEALAEAARTALTKPAGPLAPGPPARVLCADVIAPQVSRYMTELAGVHGFAVPDVIEVDSILEAEDIFDSLVGHLSGREQSAEPASPADWTQLFSEASRYARSAPWERWADSVALNLDLRGSAIESQYTVLVLGNAGIQRGLILYPGAGLPEVLRHWEAGQEVSPPEGTLLFHLDPRKTTAPEFAAKAHRYGWPDDLDLLPVLLSVGANGPADLSLAQVRHLTGAIVAIMDHDAQGPAVATDDSDTTGDLTLADGETLSFRVSQMPDVEESGEPGTARLTVHELGFDLMPPDSPVSMGALPASAMAELRRRARLHRPLPGSQSGPADADLPFIAIQPAAALGPEVAARLAEDDPFGVTVVDHQGKALVALACAHAVHALMELSSDAEALTLFRTRMDRSRGRHVVMVADQSASRGEGEIHGLFECLLPVGPPSVQKVRGSRSTKQRPSRRGKRRR